MDNENSSSRQTQHGDQGPRQQSDGAEDQLAAATTPSVSDTSDSSNVNTETATSDPVSEAATEAQVSSNQPQLTDPSSDRIPDSQAHVDSGTSPAEQRSSETATSSPSQSPETNMPDDHPRTQDNTQARQAESKENQAAPTSVLTPETQPSAAQQTQTNSGAAVEAPPISDPSFSPSDSERAKEKEQPSSAQPPTSENHTEENAKETTGPKIPGATAAVDPNSLSQTKENNFEDIPLKDSNTTKDDISNPPPKQRPVRKPTFVYILSSFATIGGFLFGYDIGIVAGSMLFIQPYFELSTFWQEAIVSGTIAAAAVAALMSGWLTDKIGRKLTIMTSSVVFTAGGVLMGAAPTKEILLVGRVVAGLGVGMASVVVPVYVAEASPVHIRGRLVSLHQLLINAGIIVSSLLAGAFSYVHPDGWRYMLGMAAVPGVLQFFGFLFLPESPRWLVGRKQMDRARAVLVRMRGQTEVSEELNDIIQTVEEAEKESAGGIQHWVKIFKTPHVRRALFVGCALLFFQQWCGINTVIYYSGTVLKMAGFPVKYAIWLVTVPNLINFLSSFIGIYLVEKIGRRLLLIISLAGTIVGLVILAVGFQLADENPAHLNFTMVERYGNGTIITDCISKYTSCLACVKDNSCGYCYTGETDGTCLPSHSEERSSFGRCNASSSSETHFKWAFEYCPNDFTWIALIGMAFFVFAFAPGLGPMPWTINSEIYPLWARSSCNSLAACTAWVCNLGISFTFLTMTENITIYGTFWLFAAITVVGVVFMIMMLPETKDKTLEEMELLFMTSHRRQEILNSRAHTTDSKTT